MKKQNKDLLTDAIIKEAGVKILNKMKKQNKKPKRIISKKAINRFFGNKNNSQNELSKDLNKIDKIIPIGSNPFDTTHVKNQEKTVDDRNITKSALNISSPDFVLKIIDLYIKEAQRDINEENTNEQEDYMSLYLIKELTALKRDIINRRAGDI